MIGKTISHYKILEELGSGGMGLVYKAQDLKLDRFVAIKILPPHLSADKEATTRFIHEAKAASALDHSNIGTIYDIDATPEGQTFIVMACYEGETLRALIDRGGVTVERAIDITSQIASGLSKAHEKGIIHRDIKPSNVMVTEDGQAKILDFGVAKLVGKTKLTETGRTLGTVSYMSPEQAMGAEVDHRSDLFSLGVVLYEMLAGKPPFEADYDTAVLYRIIHDTPTPLSELQAGIPFELEQVLTKALQKTPEKRYASASDVAVELRKIREDLGVRTKKDRVGPWLVRRRRKLLRIIVPVAAAALLVWLAFKWAPWEGSEKPSGSGTVAVAQFTVDLPEGHELFLGYGNSLALSPDGKELVYVARSGEGRKLFLRRMDQLSNKAIEGTEGAICPFVSPDGLWVGFGADGKLKKVSLESGMVVNLCDAPALAGGSWGRNGEIAFASDARSGIFVVSSNGGVPSELKMRQTEAGNASHRYPSFLPGGDAILTTVGTGYYYETDKIAVVSIKTGDRKILLDNAAWPVFLPPDHIVFARNNALYAVRFDPGRLKLRGEAFELFEALTESGGSHFAVSANGTLVLASGLDRDDRPNWKQERAYWREERVLVWVDRSDAVEPLPISPGPYVFPNVSPDGKRLAVSVFREKAVENWILELDRGVFSRITVDRNDHIPVWSPDGKKIAISSATTGSPNIFLMPVDGSTPPERLTTSEFHQDPTSWSPDGRFLAFVEFAEGDNWDIWLIDFARGREIRPFIKTRFWECHAMISPDGKWMAYTSNKSGQPEVYICPFPDGGSSIQVSSQGGSDPLWSRDGRELFFWAWNEKLTQDTHELFALMAAKVDMRDGLHVGNPTQLFKRSWVYHGGGRTNYDVMPDGRFVMLEYKGEAMSIRRLHVLLNWLDDVKRR